MRIILLDLEELEAALAVKRKLPQLNRSGRRSHSRQELLEIGFLAGQVDVVNACHTLASLEHQARLAEKNTAGFLSVPDTQTV